jgi:hypothetical protein
VSSPGTKTIERASVTPPWRRITIRAAVSGAEWISDAPDSPIQPEWLE